MSASPPPGPVGARRPADGLAGLISAMTSNRGWRRSGGGSGRRLARRTSEPSPRRARASATRARLPAAIVERKSRIVAPHDETGEKGPSPTVVDRRRGAPDRLVWGARTVGDLERERGAEDE